MIVLLPMLSGCVKRTTCVPLISVMAQVTLGGVLLSGTWIFTLVHSLVGLG